MGKFNENYVITMKDIVREGAPILRKVTDEVDIPPSEEDKETLLCMLQYLKNSQTPEIAAKYKLRSGVGLSANQIGLDKRMFAAYIVDDKGEHEYTLFNPKIISHSLTMIYLQQGEGCLSVDRAVPGYVPRYERIKVRAYDITGEEVVLKLSGYPAIVFQHEIDHLNGIMFYDHINPDNPFQLPENVEIKSVF
ncbi:MULTISPECIES: peptide deformylase [Heyndrickxia]|uniref:Peptide deformylase n=1 Tax=Heyndrickxia sporothermodurans TaxID=46224 RepID=A0A150L806_9BACI|nr:peptide deformylase [Heyndrickxia sporothermodurans]KYD08458.1 Peptide deformylase [Heyndrickxia sporothermodurans]MBL5767407.1 peptide deformylase [Heyndrickxia sporothermodurans]MBL5770757.1 peptide deformylase [Heyndrickxia sporothermodurans]MBL5774519.1 peptide deformylase [Heyndrickxia sporothermodurans]MBL5777880.1 peptide deformylase [Heyndrickxia sporothermodurans]